jgi:hypothetical protein
VPEPLNVLRPDSSAMLASSQSSKRTADPSTPQALDLFEQVSQKLAGIGCIPLTDYLHGSPSIPAPPQQQALLSTPPSIQQPQPSALATSNPSVDTVSANAISRLHQTCQRTFGSIEPLKFEFIEDGGQRSNYLFLPLFIATLIINAQAKNVY